MGEIAAAIAAEMGLDADFQRGLRVAGGVHDVGKFTVPSEILAKPGRISTLEFEMIETHAQQGYEVLMGIDFPWPAAEVARQHHERADGSGQPRGLKGEEILLEAPMQREEAQARQPLDLQFSRETNEFALVISLAQTARRRGYAQFEPMSACSAVWAASNS